MSRYGITGSSHKLLDSFLNDRKQYVTFNQLNSTLLPIRKGVPQGSIIAPTLFSIFINDLLNLHLFSTVNASADDTTFVAKSHNIFQHCNIDLSEINQCYKSNKMVINTTKSHHLLCNASPNTKFSISISGSELERQAKTKLFGYMIQDTLSWTDHVEYISKKLKANLALFQQCRFCMGRKPR